MFGCTPDIALKQNPQVVREIGEYRAARQAVELFRGGNAGAEQLGKSPGLMEILAEMTKAQTGYKPAPGQLIQRAVEKGIVDG